ncbi:MAG: hypothetical protein JW804_04975 [Sedimentisphaerales bacterium]|nr:hypothetical protein [Sedimentisphaerales bacterium]
MSNYDNFIEDFPSRCGTILEKYRKDACKNGLEVTHMFAIASASITIPFARLRDNNHPSGDKMNGHYGKAVSKFNKLCGKYFLKSRLWNVDLESWQMGEVKKENLWQDTDQWKNNAHPLSKDVKVKKVLSIVRNALAHGSIFTYPRKQNPEDQIEHIIFLSKIRNDNKPTGNYDMLMVHPDDFFDFLVKWIDFLKDLKIPSEIV